MIYRHGKRMVFLRKGKISKDAVYIKCQNCGYYEEVNKKLFAKVIGGAVVGFGGYAWIAFLFAGTGFALPLCVAIVAGGVAMMAFADQIGEWLSKRYDCPECGKRNWKVLTGETLEAETTQTKIARYDAIAVLDEIKKVYTEAEKYIYISYGWYNMNCVKQDLKFMHDAIKRGVHIFFYYGIKPVPGNEDKGKAIRTANTIRFLKENLDPEYTHFQAADTHIKAMLCDKFSLEGSQNLMSYRPWRGETPREENTLKIIGADAIEAGRQRIVAQQPWFGFEKYARS